MKVRIVDTFINRVQKPIPKNFGIKVEGEEILVPKEIVKWLGGPSNARTPEELVSVIHSFPSALIEFFKSSLPEVEQIKLEFFKELKGKVSDDYLYPPLPPKRTYNALPPPELAWQIGKTAGSIVFVNDAEKYVLLFDAVEKAKKIKAGELSFSISDFLAGVGIDLEKLMIPGFSRKAQEQGLIYQFIVESEMYLKAKIPSLNNQSVQILKDAIEQVKNGELVIVEPDMDPERYLSLQIRLQQQVSAN